MVRLVSGVGEGGKYAGLDPYSMFACSCCLEVCLSAEAAATLRFRVVCTWRAIVASLHIRGVLPKTMLQSSLVRFCT